MKLLHAPENAETGTGSPAPQPPEVPAAATAAEVVLNGKSQREIELETKLATEAAARRKAELDAAEAQDTVAQLKEIDSRRPAPVKKKKTLTRPHLWSPMVEETETDENEA